MSQVVPLGGFLCDCPGDMCAAAIDRLITFCASALRTHCNVAGQWCLQTWPSRSSRETSSTKHYDLGNVRTSTARQSMSLRARTSLNLCSVERSSFVKEAMSDRCGREIAVGS